MFLLFIYKGNGDVSLGVQGGGDGMGGHSQRAHFHSYLQMYSDEVFFIFLLRIRLPSKPMLLLLRCRDAN